MSLHLMFKRPHNVNKCVANPVCPIIEINDPTCVWIDIFFASFQRDGIEALLKVFIAKDLKVALLLQQLDLRFKNAILREEGPPVSSQHVNVRSSKNIPRHKGLEVSHVHVHVYPAEIINKAKVKVMFACLLFYHSKANQFLLGAYIDMICVFAFPVQKIRNHLRLHRLFQGSVSVAIMASKDQKL